MSPASQSTSEQELVSEDVADQRDSDVAPDSESGSETESGSVLPLDHLFEILKNERRRTVLHYLEDHDETVPLGDLAEHVAAVENDTTVTQVTSNERKCVYVGLYQCHLPKMDGMGVVAFDKPRGTIDPGEHVDCFRAYLRHDDAAADLTWNDRFVGLSILGTSFLPVALYLGTTPLLLAVALLLVAVVVGGAVWHLLGGSESGDAGATAP